MQIEPPETIHFPIHSLQELQEQRGGLRVSALGSAAPFGARGVLDSNRNCIFQAFRPPAAVAGPLTFLPPFAAIPNILR